jgi:hypothetical protein
MARSIHHWTLEALIEEAKSKKDLRSAVICIADEYVKGNLSAYLFSFLLQKAADKSISFTI